MYSNIFSAQSIQDLMSVLPSLPVAIWETFYVTVVSTALSLVLGLPLGVLLYYYEGYRQREIAGLLDIPEETVRTRLARAREKLKHILSEVPQYA